MIWNLYGKQIELIKDFNQPDKKFDFIVNQKRYTVIVIRKFYDYNNYSYLTNYQGFDINVKALIKLAIEYNILK